MRLIILPSKTLNLDLFLRQLEFEEIARKIFFGREKNMMWWINISYMKNWPFHLTSRQLMHTKIKSTLSYVKHPPYILGCSFKWKIIAQILNLKLLSTYLAREKLVSLNFYIVMDLIHLHFSLHNTINVLSTFLY